MPLRRIKELNFASGFGLQNLKNIVDRRDILGSAEVERSGIDTQPAGNLHGLLNLQQAAGIADISCNREGRQAAQRLAQQFDLLADNVALLKRQAGGAEGFELSVGSQKYLFEMSTGFWLMWRKALPREIPQK
jgi:hypothetical protein